MISRIDTEENSRRSGNDRLVTCSRISLVTLMLLMSGGTGSSGELYGQDLMNNHLPSLFSDKRAVRVGDIVTILLMEFSSGSNESKNDGKFEHDMNLASGATGLLKFLPDLSLESSISSDQKAQGGTSRKASLRGKVSARVVAVLPNGMLRLEGQRSVTVNGEQQITILSGLVRTSDILADNTVYSYLIADASIKYVGHGDVNDVTKPGIFSRIFNWIF